MSEPSNRKCYAYIDETGQDTNGDLFIVTVVMAGDHREVIRKRLAQIEKSSNKQARKWSKARRQQREAYIQQVLQTEEFIGHIYFSQYRDSKAYVDLIILSTAKAILDHAVEPYQATIFVDGLGRAERHRFSAGLRKLKVRVQKVRGSKDESEEFIRLADAIAGFVRSGLQNDATLQTLVSEGNRQWIYQRGVEAKHPLDGGFS